MSNSFTGFGNVGTAPTLRTVQVNGEDRQVCDLRVYFDRSIPDGQGGFRDGGGFWLSVTLWGPRAETAVRLLRKGARIYAEGSLREETWQDKETGADRTALRLNAERIAIDPLCIESVQFRARRDRVGTNEPEAPPEYDEDIPL